MAGSPDPPRTAPAGSRRRRTRVSGEEREGAILATLQRLLAAQPLASISVDELATGAGISRPTFYFYFASKEAALLALLEDLVDRVRAAQSGAPELLDSDREAAWRLALGASYTTWIENRDVIRAAAEARTVSPAIGELWTKLLSGFVDQTAAVIEDERARGAAPPGIPAYDLAVCLNRMNERIFETTLGDDDPTIDEERVLDAILAVWLRAIYGQL